MRVLRIEHEERRVSLRQDSTKLHYAGPYEVGYDLPDDVYERMWAVPRPDHSLSNWDERPVVFAFLSIEKAMMYFTDIVMVNLRAFGYVVAVYEIHDGFYPIDDVQIAFEPHLAKEVMRKPYYPDMVTELMAA